MASFIDGGGGVGWRLHSDGSGVDVRCCFHPVGCLDGGAIFAECWLAAAAGSQCALLTWFIKPCVDINIMTIAQLSFNCH